MGILALDLGSCLGWAARLPSGSIVSGIENFKPSRWENDGSVWLRYRKWLSVVFQNSECDQIIYEEVRNFGKFASVYGPVYGAFKSNLTAQCDSVGLAYAPLPVGTIKKFITGKGNASKSDVIAAVKSRGFNPKNDDEADAIAILLCAEDQRYNHA